MTQTELDLIEACADLDTGDIDAIRRTGLTELAYFILQLRKERLSKAIKPKETHK